MVHISPHGVHDLVSQHRRSVPIPSICLTNFHPKMLQTGKGPPRFGEPPYGGAMSYDEGN